MLSGKRSIQFDCYFEKTLQNFLRKSFPFNFIQIASLEISVEVSISCVAVRDAQDLMAIKRDHYEGTEFDLTQGMAAGPFGNPNRYPTPSKVRPEDRKSFDWERAISMFRCSYSFISQARSWLPDPIGGVLWFGEDAPHSTCYIPFYCQITEVPESFSSGSRLVFDKDHAWWAFNFVSNWADLKYSYMIEDIKAVQSKLEGDFFAMQPAIEMAALELYKKDPALAVKYLTNYSNDAANRVVDRWWKLADELVAKYDDGYVNALDSVGYPTWWLDLIWIFYLCFQIIIE